MKFSKRADNQLAAAISSIYSSIQIPDGEAAWKQMQARLIQRQKRSHRGRVFKIGIAIAALSLIVGTLVSTPNESSASMKSLLTMARDAKQGMVDILWGEQRTGNTEGAKTPPPPDVLGIVTSQASLTSSDTASSEVMEPEEATLEEARHKADFGLRVPERVPEPFALYRVRLYPSDQTYPIARLEYKNEAGENLFITERKIAANSTGWKSTVNEASGTIKEVSLNGLAGVLVLYTKGGAQLEWLWDDVAIEIYGKVSEEQMLELARSMK